MGERLVQYIPSRTHKYWFNCAKYLAMWKQNHFVNKLHVYYTEKMTSHKNIDIILCIKNIN